MLVRAIRGLAGRCFTRPAWRMFGSTPSTHKAEDHKAVDHHADHSAVDHHHEINRDKIVLRNNRSGRMLYST